MKSMIAISLILGSLSPVFAQQKAEICQDTQALKIESRVFFQQNNIMLSGNVKEIFSNNTVEIKDDNLKIVHKRFDEISVKVPCKHEIRARQHVLYPVNDGTYYTGHVREVFANGIARIVNDQLHELFVPTMALGVSRTQVGNIIKGKQAAFVIYGKKSAGKIIEVFSNKKVLIADDHSGTRVVRSFEQISQE